MIRNRFLAAAAIAAVGALTWTGIALAGDGAPSAPAPAAKAAPAATEAVTKTPSPIFSMMMWVGKQVAPNLECACVSTADGEKAWRAWFDGGKDVALAGLRDRLIADGWTADRFVTFGKEMAAKHAAGKGACDGGACPDKKGDCCGEGKGESADGKSCGGCKGKKSGEAATPPAAPAKPEETPSKP